MWGCFHRNTVWKVSNIKLPRFFAFAFAVILLLSAITPYISVPYLPGVNATSDANQTKIPSWIKNNAKWWSEGQIGDSDFTKGLQYLMDNGIMVIPTTASAGNAASNGIPSWIKNNAGWWATGQISDGEFVKGMQYLVSNGIVSTSTTISSALTFDPKCTKATGISKDGLGFIEKQEGYAGVLKGHAKSDYGFYNDQSGFCTVGYGHLIGKRVCNSGDYGGSYSNIKTQSDAEQLLKNDMVTYEKIITDNVKVPLTQEQFDALTSLVFNIGETNFKKSQVLKDLNDGNYDAVPQDLMKHVYSKGKVLQDLVKRRTTEGQMFSIGKCQPSPPSNKVSATPSGGAWIGEYERSNHATGKQVSENAKSSSTTVDDEKGTFTFDVLPHYVTNTPFKFIDSYYVTGNIIGHSTARVSSHEASTGTRDITNDCEGEGDRGFTGTLSGTYDNSTNSVQVMPDNSPVSWDIDVHCKGTTVYHYDEKYPEPSPSSYDEKPHYYGLDWRFFEPPSGGSLILKDGTTWEKNFHQDAFGGSSEIHMKFTIHQK